MAGLSSEVRDALATAPDDERALLELRLGWTGLGEAEARIAARLRTFLEPDRSPVPGCPACDGQRFGVPAELAEQRGAMCALHAELAAEISEVRLSEADESNPQGWEAIVRASSALSEPAFGLPLELLRRVEQVGERDPRAWPDEAERADAELPMALSSAGLVDEAVAVGDALAELDAESSAMHANDVAVICAQAGRVEQALERVEANLSRFPDDVWTRIHAGDVHVALSDPERAEAAFREALAIAHARGDAYGLAAAEQRLSELLAGIPGREREARAAAQEAGRAERAAHSRSRIAPKVGRNEPCPCGSGRKYKRCCGG